MAPLPKHITILGGGLTGLTVAYRLANLARKQSLSGSASQLQISLIEKSERLGGWVHSQKRSIQVPQEIRDRTGAPAEVDVVIEKGPRSIRPKGSVNAAYMLKLLQDLGLSDKILPVSNDHPSAKNRFILDPRVNQLVKLPSGLADVLTLALNPSGRGKGMLARFLRSILLEPLSRKRAKRESGPDVSVQEGKGKANFYNDTSVDKLVRSTLGPRIADALISSMVHGIYAADSRALSVRSTFPILWNAVQARGSLLLGLLLPRKAKTESELAIIQSENQIWEALGDMNEQRKTWSVYGIKGGIETLTHTLVKEIREAGVDLRLGQKLARVQPTEEGCEVSAIEIDPANKASLPCARSFQLTFEDGDKLKTSLLISTLTPKALDTIIKQDQGLPHLRHNPSTNVGVVNFVFPAAAETIHPAGFGYLVPRTTDSIFFPPGKGQTPNPDGIIGVVFDSSSMTGVEDSPLIASDFTKLTVMMGGPHWSTYPADPSAPGSKPIDIPASNELPRKALAHLKKVFPSIPDPVLSAGYIQYDCIPTYLIGHGQRLRELHEAIHGSEWAGKLVLLGSGYGGVGVNDCVGMAEQTVALLKACWAEPAASKSRVTTGLERWKDWN